MLVGSLFCAGRSRIIRCGSVILCWFLSVDRCRLLWFGRFVSVRSLWVGRYELVALYRSLWEGLCMTVAMGRLLLVVGWSLWVGRCWSCCALCRSFCNGCFVSLVSALWDNGCSTVAVGRLLWVGCYGLVTIGWSLLVVVGRSLYVFASCWCLLCKGCLVVIVLCWSLIVGYCGTVAVGQSLWFGSY